MTQLTSDIVWLVERTITQADGTRHTVLALQLYIEARTNEQAASTPSGAHIGTGAINTDTQGANLNQAGTIAVKQTLAIRAGQLTHRDGGILSGQKIALQTQGDINP